MKSIFKLFMLIADFFVSVFKMAKRHTEQSQMLEKLFEPAKKKKCQVRRSKRVPGKLIWNALKQGTMKRQTAKVGRNDPCTCGATRVVSNRHALDTRMKSVTFKDCDDHCSVPVKFKHCCGRA